MTPAELERAAVAAMLSVDMSNDGKADHYMLARAALAVALTAAIEKVKDTRVSPPYTPEATITCVVSELTALLPPRSE